MTSLINPRICVSSPYDTRKKGAPSPASVEVPTRRYMEWSTSVSKVKDWTQNSVLAGWVLDVIKLVQPARVHLCDGSEEEYQELLNKMVHTGTLIPLNPNLRPGCYYARSSPSDVARVEERTFIATENPKDAGFTNNWQDSDEMMRTLHKLFEGAMRGRTMFVIPFIMGPANSEFSQLGVQITDSPYAVVSMKIMTRMGQEALDMLQDGRSFVPCLHSVGVPLSRGEEDSTWPCNKDKYIVHFPNQQKIYSYGSGYGGNALLGKKCFALRIASAMARDEGWLAEHMLIVGITNPQGIKRYVAAAFPSACGKTNLAMLRSRLPGWKVECVGDDIAWMRIGKDGRLWAVNPEAGFFGVAPGTSNDSNPMAMETIKTNTIFTNTAITPEGDVWWEGMTKNPPERVTNWLRQEVISSEDASDKAHPNSRFTVPASQCPVLDPAYYSKEGVPIDAIIFGGRRSTTVPLVYQAKSWQHGVFLGASMTSETTAAAAGKRGVLRSDPFAMRPFCGYNMGDYFGHWLSFNHRTDPSKLPKVFHVNWFRKSKQGKFLWPGFGENIRVLDWILKQCDPKHSGEDRVLTSIGYVPAPGAINVDGLELAADAMEELNRIDASEWLAEIRKTKEFLSNFGDRLPEEIQAEADALEKIMEQQHKEAIQQRQSQVVKP